jgi:hypothetical protein
MRAVVSMHSKAVTESAQPFSERTNLPLERLHYSTTAIARLQQRAAMTSRLMPFASTAAPAAIAALGCRGAGRP